MSPELTEEVRTELPQDEPICCDLCGERIRGHSYLQDGLILCGLCLDDLQKEEEKP